MRILRIELEGNDAHASDFKDKDGIIAQRPVFKSSVKSGKNSIVLWESHVKIPKYLGFCLCLFILNWIPLHLR